MSSLFNKIWEKYNKNPKTVMVILRKEENQKILINETSWMPDNVTMSERLYCWVNGLTEIPKCPVCGKPRKYNCYTNGYFATCGDKSCKSARISQGNKECQRDWVAIQAKMKETYAKNHNGYTHNMQDPEFKKKFFDDYAKKHNGEKCGVCTEKAKENREKTFEERGGLRQMLEQGIVDKFGSVQECIKINNISRAKIKSDNDKQKLIGKLNEMNYTYISNESSKMLQVKCNKCGHIFSIAREAVNIHYRNKSFNFCPICDFKDMTFRSHFEKEIGEEIKKFYSGEIICNKYINGHECDIIIPDLKIAIECNGIYWHTEQYKEKNAHQLKKIAVENVGYDLIQIWEDDWRDCIKHEIILSTLKIKFNIYNEIQANDCNIKQVPISDAKNFLAVNHINGSNGISNFSSLYKYGLYYGNELMQLIVIGNIQNKSKNNDQQEKFLELYRICTKQGYNIIDGFKTLLYYFKNNISSEKIIVYADCDWCNIKNNEYTNVGFKYIKIIKPDYWYNVGNIRKPRYEFTKKKLVNEEFDANKSVIEIMHNKGYFRIFDSGKILFEI